LCSNGHLTLRSTDQIAALTEFILSVGLRLAEQLDNEFEAALDRLIARKAALCGQIDLEDYVTTRITRSGGTSTMSRVKSLVSAQRLANWPSRSWFEHCGVADWLR
jgi:hypothetical protein